MTPELSKKLQIVISELSNKGITHSDGYSFYEPIIFSIGASNVAVDLISLEKLSVKQLVDLVEHRLERLQDGFHTE